jgi:hypothetical protein
MGIALKGHAPDFQYWVFDIDGKTWVAINQSTPEPLNINFIGAYRNWPSNLPLINTSGFDIIGSTTAATNDLGEKQGKVEWVWAGKRYLSTWVLGAGREISPADPEEGVPATFEYGLNFVGRTPYEGPAGGTVGSTGIPPTTPPPQTTPPSDSAIETQQALDNANKALAISEQQRKVNVEALNTARVELQNAKDTLAAAEARATKDQAALMESLREQLGEIEQRTNIQLNIYKKAVEQSQADAQAAQAAAQAAAAQAAASQQQTRVIAPMESPIKTTPAATAAVTPAGTDWVKLGLQLGAAYLILS